MIRFEPQHFKEIQDFILDYSGIVLERVPQKSIYEKIRKHIESLSLKKADEYINLLRNPGSLPIRDELISLVTVNESFFFRNPSQYRFLFYKALPHIIEAKKKAGLKQITFWSAGCATGEETFSIAYFAKLIQNKDNQIQINIFGTDINTLSLEKARSGTFRKRSIRKQYFEILKEFKEPFLEETSNGEFIVPQKFKDLVFFKFLNLKDFKGLASMKRVDIIFCRNVLIYFTDTFKSELLNQFRSLLNDNGLLFLGETESIPSTVKGFTLMNCNGGFCYMKGQEK